MLEVVRAGWPVWWFRLWLGCGRIFAHLFETLQSGTDAAKRVRASEGQEGLSLGGVLALA